MGMMINRRRVLGGKSLPYDYEVEYLESFGEHSIDTLIVPNNTLEVKIKWMPLEGFDDCYALIAGGNLEKSGFAINYYNPDKIFRVMRWAWPRQSYWQRGRFNAIYTMESYPSRLVINGSNIGRTNYSMPETITDTLKIFSILSYSPYCRVYYCSIKLNGDLVRDFIPVVKDNIGYMYDKVSGQLFGNAGTSNFILGPEVQ